MRSRSFRVVLALAVLVVAASVLLVVKWSQRPKYYATAHIFIERDESVPHHRISDRWIALLELVGIIGGLFGLLLWLGKDIEPKGGGGSASDGWDSVDDHGQGHGHDGGGH